MTGPSRENAIIAASVVGAIVAWYAVVEGTDLGSTTATAIALFLGVVVPTILVEVVGD